MIKFDMNKDSIMIIAPSGSCSTYELSNKNLNLGVKFLREQGFKVKIHPEIFAKNVKSYYFYANTKENRLQSFIDALLDEDVKIIWCFRGGAGANEIVHDLVRLGVKPKCQKILVGFSDATVLLTYFSQILHLPCIHCSVINQIEQSEDFLKCVTDFILGKHFDISLTPINENATKANKIESKVIGGNLGILQSIIATNIHPKCERKILILEDINELPFQIKRTLIHFLESGVINSNIDGIIFGRFCIDKHEKHQMENFNSIKDFVFEYINDIPCFFSDDFGHNGLNKPIPFGTRVVLSSNAMQCDSIFDIIK